MGGGAGGQEAVALEGKTAVQPNTAKSYAREKITGKYRCYEEQDNPYSNAVPPLSSLQITSLPNSCNSWEGGFQTRNINFSTFFSNLKAWCRIL